MNTAVMTKPVHSALTLGLTSLYALLACYCIAQLCRILYFRHKKRSYQFFFFLLSAAWTLFRAILFAVKLVSSWPLLLYRILYSIPLCLQFCTFSLLLLYFAQIVHKNRWGTESRYDLRRVFFAIWGFVNVFLLALNMICVAVLGNRDNIPLLELRNSVIIRVSAIDISFVLLAVFIVLYVYRISHMKTVNLMLQAKGTDVKELFFFGIAIPFFFVSRAIYNFVNLFINPLDSWNYVNDDLDFENDFSYSYLFLFGAMLLWEIIPFLCVLYLFRVRPRKARLSNTAPIANALLHDSASLCSSFFDDPRRYDSDSDEETTLCYPYEMPHYHTYSEKFSSCGPSEESSSSSDTASSCT